MGKGRPKHPRDLRQYLLIAGGHIYCPFPAADTYEARTAAMEQWLADPEVPEKCKKYPRMVAWDPKLCPAVLGGIILPDYYQFSDEDIAEAYKKLYNLQHFEPKLAKGVIRDGRDARRQPSGAST